MDRCSARTYLLFSFPIMLLGQFRTHRGGKKLSRRPARHNSTFSFSPGYWRHAFQDCFCYIHEHSFPLCTFVLLPPSRACLLPFSPERISRDSGNAELLSVNEFSKSSTEKVVIWVTATWSQFSVFFVAAVRQRRIYDWYKTGMIIHEILFLN